MQTDPKPAETKPIQIPSETHKRLKGFCVETQRPMGELASEIINCYIDRKEINRSSLKERAKRHDKH